MKPALMSAAWIGLAVCSGTSPLLAQMHNNTEKQLTCQNGNYGNDQARHCEIREQSVPGVGRLNVDIGQNGGANVKGWLRGEVLVRARVESAADTQAEADSMASRVIVDSSGAQVRATGPESANNSSWSVSYEIFVPQFSDLTLKGNNGGLTISDVRGEIHFEVNNGGVKLNRVAGDVSGTTVNGGITADLAGFTWDGRQLELNTHNGGVTITLPANYSAHLQAETGMGSIQSDFPVTMQGNIRSRKMDFSLGSGGPLIHVTTGNGGIKIKRAETQ